MKTFWWIAAGTAILVVLAIAAGKGTKGGISTEAWRNLSPNASRVRLPGIQMKCVGGKLDPICVGHRFSMAQGKYGNWVSHESLKEGKVGSTTYSTSGIAGWYIRGSACRFYYIMENSIQCLDGSPCGIIKEIACE